MRKAPCWIMTLLALIAGWGVTGCVSSKTAALLRDSDDLAADMQGPASGGMARMQRPEPPRGQPKGESSVLFPASSTQPTSVRPARNSKVVVRAFVNGRPIFDDEIMQSMSPRALAQINTLGEPQRSERLAEAYNQALDSLIEQEVAYQEAVRKLEVGNARGLDKLKEMARGEFEKQVARVEQESRVSPEELRELLPTLRRQMERSFISMEYMRSRIFPYLMSRISHEEVKEYYDTHANEFTKVDSVQWQDVFIAISPKLPTIDHCRKFAGDLLAQTRSGEEFAKLAAVHDDGDSKYRGGAGFGARKGEIKPPELEDYLFNMRDGEVGPIVDFTTGVHLFRLVKRDRGGVTPLNEQLQTQIRNKLRGQVADREYKRIVRELKARAVIEIEKEGG